MWSSGRPAMLLRRSPMPSPLELTCARRRQARRPDMNTLHLVVISGNDSSIPVVRPPDTTITLVQTPDRATDFQRSAVDRFIEVPEISAPSLIELLWPIHRTTPVTALACFLESAILAAAV